jgi:hypothetical protein
MNDLASVSPKLGCQAYLKHNHGLKELGNHLTFTLDPSFCVSPEFDV